MNQFESQPQGAVIEAEVPPIQEGGAVENQQETLEMELPPAMNGGFDDGPKEVFVTPEELQHILKTWAVEESQLIPRDEVA